MALNKKACARIGSVLCEHAQEVGMTPKQTIGFVNRITKAADTDNKSFRKTMRRIAKSLKSGKAMNTDVPAPRSARSKRLVRSAA
jgi:hypothetical protein